MFHVMVNASNNFCHLLESLILIFYSLQKFLLSFLKSYYLCLPNPPYRDLFRIWTSIMQNLILKNHFFTMKSISFFRLDLIHIHTNGRSNLQHYSFTCWLSTVLTLHISRAVDNLPSGISQLVYGMPFNVFREPCKDSTRRSCFLFLCRVHLYPFVGLSKKRSRIEIQYRDLSFSINCFLLFTKGRIYLFSTIMIWTYRNWFYQIIILFFFNLSFII